VGWLLTLPASGLVGAAAAAVIVWLQLWGILIDSVLAVAVILYLFLRSRRDEVTAANAMSEVADSGLAVKVTKNPPPTRRQRQIMREEARRRADLEAKERAKRKAQAKAAAKAGKDAQAAAKSGGTSSTPDAKKTEMKK